ncbi:MAG: hypothetical protein ACLQU1_21645 [Bryobacteraceae bacterium]
MRPRAGIVMRAAWRTWGSARPQPQETEEPSSGLLPHQRTGRRRRSRPAVAGPPPAPHRGGTPGGKDWFGRAAGTGAGQRSGKPAPLTGRK